MDHRLTFPPRASVLTQLRVRVRALAVRMGASVEAGDRLALVVDELVNNAVEHGAVYRQRGLDLALELHVAGDRTRIEFFDPEMPIDQLLGLPAASDAPIVVEVTSV